MAIKVEVDAAEVLKKLRQLDDSVVGNGVVKAINAGGLVVEGRAKINVPVDTGFLRSTIATDTQELTKTSAESSVYATAHYAPYVELGTIRTSAHPYLEPALNQNRAEVIEAVTRVFASIIMGV